MVWGLLLGNLIDLDHIYYRIIGKVPWFESACNHIGQGCSIGIYPLHNMNFAISSLLISSLIFHNNKRLRFIGWLGLGAFLNILLDYIHMITGFGF